MNKDQLLNSVRDLVYRLKTTECKGTIVNSEALRELRELLDKTICKACKACRGSGHIDNLRSVGEPAMTCPCCIVTPEPVGEVCDMKYNVVRFYRATGDTSKPYLIPGTKLYVEQPASSIIFPGRKPASMSNEFQLAEEWYEELGYNQAIDDIKRLNGIE